MSLDSTRPRHRLWLPALAAAILALTGCTGTNPDGGQQPTASESAGSGGSSQAQGSDGQDGTGQGDTGQGGAGQGGGDEVGFAEIPGIIDEVQPSVVTVFNDKGLGSGVIYTEDGLILTNAHVVGDADRVEIGFADGKRVQGRVIATDRVTDLALVRVERTGLPAAEFETDLPQVGSLAIVIGSPLGFENSASVGIISGLHREIPGSAASNQSLVDLIQTDAAISPGNSGGAVVNAQGEVVGISEAYIPPQTGAVSLGFAIPAATVVEVAEELIEDGSADHAYLGLVPRTLTPQIATQLGLERENGVVVLSVEPGTPADQAGLEPGDLLISLNGEELQTSGDLIAALRSLNPGDTIEAKVVRGGEVDTVEITVAERPSGNSPGPDSD